VLYELCTLKHPFTGANQAGLILRIVRGKYEPIPSFYSKELSDIVAHCLQRDTRKRYSIQDLLDSDVIQKKAKTLGFKIPSKIEVLEHISNQHTEMKSTFMRKRTEIEPKKKKSESAPKSGSESTKNKTPSHLADYKNNAPKRRTSTKTDSKSDHEIKVMELENKINERKKKHSENLDNKNYKINNKNMPVSYLKDPSMAKAKSEQPNVRPSKDKQGDLSDNKYVNKSALCVDLPKAPKNQKVIKDGIKHDEAKLVIEKPKRPAQSSHIEQRSKPSTSAALSSNNRVRGGQQSTGTSRAAQLAARKGSGLVSKKPVKNAKNDKKKEIEDV
jgi:serine/threonine protein kinase